MGSPNINIGVRADTNGTATALRGVAEEIKGVGAAAAGIGPGAAKAGDALKGVGDKVKENGDIFRRVRSEQEAIEAAWVSALEENAARAKAAHELEAKAAQQAANEAKAAIREQDEAEAEHIHHLEELQIIAARSLKSGSIAGVIGATGEIAGIAATAGVLEHFVDKAKEAAIESEHLAAASGLTVTQLVSLEQAMKEAGAPTEGLGQAVIRFSRAIDEAQKGEPEQIAYLKQLGITSKDFSTALTQVAAHLHESTDATADNSAMLGLFGRGTIQMIGFLKEAGSDLPSLTAKWHEFGEAVERSGESARKLNQLEVEAQSILQKQASESLPFVNAALRAVADTFIDLTADVKIFTTAWTAQFENFATRANLLWEEIKLGSKRAFTISGSDAEKVLTHQIELAKQSAAEQIKSTDAASDAQIANINKEADAREAALASKAPKEEAGRTAEEPGGIQFGAKASAREQQLSAEEKYQKTLLQIKRDAIEASYRQGLISASQEKEALTALIVEETGMEIRFNAQKAALYQDDAAKLAEFEGQKKNTLAEGARQVQEAANKFIEANQHAAEAADKEIARLNKQSDEQNAAWGKLAEKAEDATRKQIDEQAKANDEGLKRFDQQQIARVKALKEQVEDHKKAQAEIELGELEHQKRMIELQKDTAIEGAKAAGVGSAEQLALLKRYDAQLDAINAKISAARETERGLTGTGPESRAATAKVSGGAALDETRIAEAKELQKEIDDISKEFESVFSKMNSQLTSSVDNWISGTKRFGVAFRDVPRDMLKDWTSSLLQMGLKYVENTYLIRGAETALAATLKALGLEEASSKVAAAAAAHAAGAPVRIAEVTSAAAVGAANAAAATAAIPVVGPALAPGAGAAMFAAIEGWASIAAFEGGGLTGDSAMLGLLHPHEMVLPAPITQHIMQSFSAGGGNSRSTVLHYHGYEGQSRQSMKDDAAFMDKQLRRRERLHNNN